MVEKRIPADALEFKRDSYRSDQHTSVPRRLQFCSYGSSELINFTLESSNYIFWLFLKAPSVYCQNRKRALEHLLDRFHTDELDCTPFFLFGDFNFRTETHDVVKVSAKLIVT